MSCYFKSIDNINNQLLLDTVGLNVSLYLNTTTTSNATVIFNVTSTIYQITSANGIIMDTPNVNTITSYIPCTSVTFEVIGLSPRTDYSYLVNVGLSDILYLKVIGTFLTTGTAPSQVLLPSPSSSLSLSMSSSKGMPYTSLLSLESK